MWHITKKIALAVLLLCSVKSNAQSVTYGTVAANIVTDVNQLRLTEQGFTDISMIEIRERKGSFIGLQTSDKSYTVSEPRKINVVAARLIVSGALDFDFDITMNETVLLQQASNRTNIYAYLIENSASGNCTNHSEEQVVQINAQLMIDNQTVAGMYIARDFEICLNYY